jgi:chemotaxis protein MotB
MQRIGFSFLGLAAAMLTGVGCVPQEKYNAARLSLDAANERLAQAESEAAAARAASEAYRRQIEAISSGDGSRDAALVNLTSQLTDLQARYAKVSQDLELALQNQGRADVRLAPELDSALTEFARQNPDLVDFDSARGIVKFKSDVTFATGKDELKPDARTAIARFAQILNSSAANGYELQVAGHTDSQQVKNQATIKAGHKDNWYLSSHRAISVGKELQSQRVDSRRIAVVGYADQHPVASNANESGRQQNRRVEVVILPTQARAAGGATAAGDPTAPADANKDSSATLGREPAFEDDNNK